MGYMTKPTKGYDPVSYEKWTYKTDGVVEIDIETIYITEGYNLVPLLKEWNQVAVSAYYNRWKKKEADFLYAYHLIGEREFDNP